ncbi:UvrD-helicase domain-containing protein [Lutibacter sp.]|uniref:UvrD-helicase domain-containing protein n=1 Tax=Lutibacter sp. TaxID=1925666 RepID=UPI003568D686
MQQKLLVRNSASFQVYNASAGSGKTFTLVKEYLKILLTSNNTFKFQQILAVTFTNKAAGEMKARVIENLHAFSKEEKNDMLPVICEETNLTETVIIIRSQAVLNAILQNYSAFGIMTIDSFTHKLIRTFAYDLGLPLNFEVEMDAESLLNEAVDVVISKIGSDKKLTDLLVSYSLQKLEDDKAWDISLELKSFAKIILNETDAANLKSLRKISIEEFTLLKEKLQKENNRLEVEFLNLGNKGLNIINENGLELGEFGYAGEFPNHFIKLTKLKYLKVDDLKFEGRLNTTIEENKNLFSAKCSSASKQIIETIAPVLKELYHESKKLYTEKYPRYILNNLIVEGLIPLAVLNYINNALQEIKSENNILLNAEFNQLIGDTIKNEPAPFIYERIGEKFRYYFIDEMQDTSQLQWKNLIPLIDHAISSEDELGESGKLLLVGDAKQSIYRWRGGKSEQFIYLSSEEKDKNTNPFFVEKTLSNLETNFRSYSEIIDFNNCFFKHSSQFLTNISYRNLFFDGNSQNFNKKTGGYVQISFVEKNDDAEDKTLVYPKKVAEIIQNLDPSFKKNEVCVLVRKKDQGIAVAKYLSENGIEIISSETLLLKNNEKINFIIDLLNTVENPSYKEYKIKLLYFLHEYFNLEEEKHHFLSRFIRLSTVEFFEGLKKFGLYFNVDEFHQSPFYESIEYIVRSFNLATDSDSNIQFFLDVVFEFQQKKKVSVGSFLEFWELKKDKLSIVAPEAENAVRIMTIHKAKGLEFPIVIFPYDIEIYRQINPKVWYTNNQSDSIKQVFLNYGDKLNYIGEQGKQLFEQRREELELDNFNLLYVTLTRAVEQLYVVTEDKTGGKNGESVKYTSDLFIQFLKKSELWNPEKNEYSFGNPKRLPFSKREESSTTIQQSFIGNSWKNHHISIVANSSLLWDTEQGNAIVYGNLLHEMLSKIKTKNDIFEVTNQFLFKGEITIEEQKELTIILNKVINHHQLSGYFEQNNLVFTEREILTSDKQILIPDRLIFNGDKVTILDYKTGKPEEKHRHQINAYSLALENLNYSIEKKLLVYITDEILIEEV